MGLACPANPPSQRRTKAGSRVIAGAAFALALAAAPALLCVPAWARGPDSLADLAASVSDAVVNISAAQMVEEKSASAMPDLPRGTPFDDLFDEFFRHQQQQQGEGGGPAPLPRQRRSNSLGSGFVIDPSGIIVTNNHVIADANEITVIFTDGAEAEGGIDRQGFESGRGGAARET